MCRYEKRGICTLKRCEQDIEQMLRGRMIELACWFICQNKFWLGGQSPGYSYTLRLSAREFFGQFLRDESQSYAIKCIQGRSSCFICAIFSKQQGNLHILNNCKWGQ